MAEPKFTPQMCYELQKNGIKPNQPGAVVDCTCQIDGEYFEMDFKCYGTNDFSTILHLISLAFARYWESKERYGGKK